MVFLGPKGAEIEIRLVKPPFDVDESARVYIAEYEMLGMPYREKGSCECYQYIASEDTTYAIEITLKKGFVWGKYQGIFVLVHDRARKAKIGRQVISKDDFEKILAHNKKIVVTSLSG